MQLDKIQELVFHVFRWYCHKLLEISEIFTNQDHHWKLRKKRWYGIMHSMQRIKKWLKNFILSTAPYSFNPNVVWLLSDFKTSVATDFFEDIYYDFFSLNMIKLPTLTLVKTPSTFSASFSSCRKSHFWTYTLKQLRKKWKQTQTKGSKQTRV